MTEPKISVREAEALRRFILLLPHKADPVLIVLKAHLLIEEQLRQLVDERFTKPEALLKGKFECDQVICMAEAFCGDNLHPAMWVALRKLNALRNEFAHKLEPTGVSQRMAYIAKIVGETHPMWEGDMPWPDRMTEFDAAMWVLFTRVSALVERPSAQVVSIAGLVAAE